MSTESDPAVLEALRNRGVTRVTHFSNSMNLPSILEIGGILSTAALDAQSVAFERTDHERYDGHLGHICCNLEYPNWYYLNQATGKPAVMNYNDWALFLIDPAVAAAEGTLFCPRNAAKLHGAEARTGAAGLELMYAANSYGYQRGPTHHPASPTDVQAEVLIPDFIPVSAVLGIVVPDDEAVRRERERLRQFGLDPDQLEWSTGRGFFTRSTVVRAVQQHQPIALQPWKTGQEGKSE